MKLGLITRLRRYRRPAVMIGAGLIAAQAFLATTFTIRFEMQLNAWRPL